MPDFASCAGEAVLVAPGKSPGAEHLFVIVGAVSARVTLAVAGDTVELTIGKTQVRYSLARFEPGPVFAAIPRIGDLSEARRAVWTQAVNDGPALGAANATEVLVILREGGRPGFAGLMVKDGNPAAMLALECTA